MHYRTLLLPCLLACSVSAFAAAQSSTRYTACMDKSEGITSKMNDCTYAELKQQDVRLNTQYKRADAGTC